MQLTCSKTLLPLNYDMYHRIYQNQIMILEVCITVATHFHSATTLLHITLMIYGLVLKNNLSAFCTSHKTMVILVIKEQKKILKSFSSLSPGTTVFRLLQQNINHHFKIFSLVMYLIRFLPSVCSCKNGRKQPFKLCIC